MIISTKKNETKSEEDLDGKTVGVQLGSIQQDAAEELSKSIDLKVETRDRIPELIQDLQNGRFDAIIIENTVANGYLNKSEDLKGSTMNVNEEEAGSAVALPKDSELTAEFNEALKSLKKTVNWINSQKNGLTENSRLLEGLTFQLVSPSCFNSKNTLGGDYNATRF